MNIPIQTIVNEQLALEREKPHVKSNSWSPSSFGQCLRRQYWNRVGEPVSNPPDERVLRVFKSGNLFHNFVKAAVKERFPGAEFEVLAIDDDHNIIGYADIVLEDEVIELKTQHSRKFWRQAKDAKEGVGVAEHNPDHLMQLVTYCHILNKPFGRLVYISKDDLCIEEYKLSMNGKWNKMIIPEVTQLNSFLEKKQLPPAKPRLYGLDRDGNPKECSYCNFKDRCRKEELGG